MASSIEDVLGNVEGSLVAFGAEAASFAVHFIWTCAGEAVGGVAGECFHDIELVVMGKTRVGHGNGREADLTRWGSHCNLSRFGFW